MNFEDLLTTAAELNQQGARHLSNCKSKEAHFFFRQALGLVEKVSVHPENNPFCYNKYTSLIHSYSIVPNFDDDVFYIYNRVLTVSREEHSNTVDGISIFSAAIIFNLSLVYHKAGMSASDSIKLGKALELYAHCIGLSEANNHLSTSEDFLLLQVTALNNMIHIHKNLASAPEVIDRLHMALREVLPFAADTWKWDPQALDEIVLNVFALHATRGAPAA